jgi:hypothetical protein
MIGAVATMATRWRRRIPPASWASLGGQGSLQTAFRGTILCALVESGALALSASLHIIVLAIRSNKSTELFANLGDGLRIVSDNASGIETFEQLFLEGLTESNIIFLLAFRGELVKHVLESGSSILLGLREDSKAAETSWIIHAFNHTFNCFRLLLSCLELQEREGVVSLSSSSENEQG